MTMVLRDAERHADSGVREALRSKTLAVLLYADDTLLVGRDQVHMQSLLGGIAQAGARVGMELHWDKFQFMPVRCDMSLTTPQGEPIPAKESIVYLGATISSSGRLSGELNKRLGAAWGEFCRYRRAWKHTAIAKARKLQVFQSLVTSKVMYSLNSAWLNKAERRQLDGFQARCLRSILHIPSAYISRVPNRDVLLRANQEPYTTQLLKQQLLWFGKIGRASNSNLLRRLTFQDGCLRPATDACARAVGRPRNEWAKCLMKTIGPHFASKEAAMQSIREPAAWRKFVADYVSSLPPPPPPSAH